MKRASMPRRRERRSGISPYQRHSKAPYRYSGAYYDWFYTITGKQHAEERQLRAHRASQRMAA